MEEGGDLPPERRAGDKAAAPTSLTASLPPDQPRNLSTLLILEASIFNMSPLNEIVRVVGDFLYEHVGKPNVEIEAKLGLLVDKGTNRRIALPVLTETVLSTNDEHRFRFESSMTAAQHEHYNRLLNELVVNTAKEGYSGAKVEYKHTRETDRFYQSTGGGRGSARIRVTTDQKDGKILDVVEKIRVANLNVFCPKLSLDYRISVNIEKPAEFSQGSQPSFERNKDRLSYSHQIFKVDLTQVKGASGPTHAPEVSHELELEFIDPELLAREKSKLGGPEESTSQYLEMIEMFLNSVRMLARKAKD
jgi:hypothetical protein